MRLSVVALVAFCACAPVPPAGRNAGSGIPQGVYIGESSCSNVMTLVSADGTTERIESPGSDLLPIIREYGADGNELTAQGTPLTLGDGVDTVLGPFSGSTFLKSFSLADDTLAQNYDAVIVFDDPTLGPILLTGGDTVIHEFIEPNLLTIKRTGVLSSSIVDGELLLLETSCLATLTRQDP